MRWLIGLMFVSSVCLVMRGGEAEAIALGPGFTYQGRFDQDGVPFNGSVNLRFSLWDDLAEGNAIGFEDTATDVPVVEGAFAVVVNPAGEFGVDAFNGDARWLQIEICDEADCLATTVLSPRQLVSAAPYAAHAPGPWKSGAPGTIFTDSSIGIGTDSPDAKLQVNDGRIRIRETGTPERWDLFYEPASEKFYLQENAAFNHLVFTKGPDNRIGVGTNDPAAGSKLHALNSATGGVAMVAEAPGGNGLVGKSAATGFGATAGTHSGTDGIGVYGEANTGSSAYGVYGKSNQGTAVYGVSNIGDGVSGVSNVNIGVKGSSNTNIGVRGVSVGSNGVEGRSESSQGVYGYSTSGTGVYGQSDSTDQNTPSIWGDGQIGVRGDGSDTGVYAVGVGAAGTGIFADAESLAGLFGAKIIVNGDVISEKSVYQIDHPLDPKNKYLSHSSVESPELTNLYNGIETTDAEGYAEVILPDYFEALNRDFRYQLTVIDGADSDQFVLAKVVQEIEGNRFTIRSSRPGTKVSWQVTGIRNDPYAKANPLEVEAMKTPRERDKYLNPELYGQPKEKGIHYRAGLKRETAKVPTAGKEEETK